MGEFDELSKEKEEQDERVDLIKIKNKDFEVKRQQCEQDIFNQAEEIDKINKMIEDSKIKKAEKEE